MGQWLDLTLTRSDVINILRGKVNNQASVDAARQLFHICWDDYNGTRTEFVEINDG
jgi:hypothetical protein